MPLPTRLHWRRRVTGSIEVQPSMHANHCHWPGETQPRLIQATLFWLQVSALPALVLAAMLFYPSLAGALGS